MGIWVDPVHFTDYDRTDAQLEATAIFSVLVAGKTALTVASALDRLLGTVEQPFMWLRTFNYLEIRDKIRACGIGCYRLKARSLYALVRSGINLRTCTADELDAIHGIGPKTARMFILHTRRNARVAALDVHILQHLRDLGYPAPRSTPGSHRQYNALEVLCLRLADQAGMTPADWDLTVWNLYRRRLSRSRTNAESVNAGPRRRSTVQRRATPGAARLRRT